MNRSQFPVSLKNRAIKRILTLGSAIMAIILVNSCSDAFSPGRSEFVVVDVVSVARAMGRDEVIVQKLQEANALLNNQLTEISNNLQQHLREEQSKLDKSEKEKRTNLNVQTQLKLRQTQLLAKQKAEQFRSKLLLEFRQEVLGAAKKIAQDRGASSIQIVNNDLLWHSPSIDITADVIKVLRASAVESITEKKPKEKGPKTQSRSGESQESAKTPPESSEEVKELNNLMDNINKKE